MKETQTPSIHTAWEEPQSLEHACELLDRGGPAWQVAAGCTAISPSELIANPEIKAVVDVMALDPLSGIEQTKAGIRIGATTTLAAVEASSLVSTATPLLAHAAAGIGDAVIRGMATVGGNLALRAARAHELPVAMSALDAQLEISSAKGLRTVAAAELCDRDFSLEAGELITAIEVSAASGAWAYRKLSTNLDSYGIACLAIAGLADGTPRVFAGLGESIPQRLPVAEAALAGDASSALVDGAAEVAERACAELIAVEDALSSAAYRKRALAAVLAAELKRLAGGNDVGS